MNGDLFRKSRHYMMPHSLYTRGRGAISLFRTSLMKRRHELPILELESVLQGNVQIETPVLDDICLPPYSGSNDHDDLIPLMKMVKSFEPQIVVELGTAHGNTVANICRQCPSARVYTVNAPVEDQTGTLTTYELDREQIGRVYRAYGFADRVVQIFKNTLYLDLSEYFHEPVIDLALIDACHDTDYVINDFFKLLPFMRARGVVLFHDAHPSMRDHLRGSYMACMMLRRRGYDIQHIKNTWWAIWFK